MRVVAGELRGRRIDGPPESKNHSKSQQVTRPTTDKVREAIFNSLGSMGVVVDAVVVDLFAGSGALGIEALSRGAKHCTFVENDRIALQVLRANIEALGLASRSTIVTTDLLRDVSGGSADRIRLHVSGAELVLADPPYGFTSWPELFSVVLEASPEAVLVAETETGADIHATPPPGWLCLRSRDYGRTAVGFFVSATSRKFSTD
ncbi:MAG: hypothetical protein RJB08_807 [Actinomycetota bacterium]|jgi:16S rRNA (guanine966-N2)-methyltransferase